MLVQKKKWKSFGPRLGTVPLFPVQGKGEGGDVGREIYNIKRGSIPYTYSIAASPHSHWTPTREQNTRELLFDVYYGDFFKLIYAHPYSHLLARTHRLIVSRTLVFLSVGRLITHPHLSGSCGGRAEFGLEGSRKHRDLY